MGNLLDEVKLVVGDVLRGLNDQLVDGQPGALDHVCRRDQQSSQGLDGLIQLIEQSERVRIEVDGQMKSEEEQSAAVAVQLHLPCFEKLEQLEFGSGDVQIEIVDGDIAQEFIERFVDAVL